MQKVKRCISKNYWYHLQNQLILCESIKMENLKLKVKVKFQLIIC